MVQGVLGCIPDQPHGIAHLLHDGVTGIDAGCTGNALQLQAVADVDPGRAYLDAPGAVHAVSLRLVGSFRTTAPRSAWLASLGIVGNDQRVAIEHRALEARVWAHVLADLLAQMASVRIGRDCIEQDPEALPGTRRTGQDLRPQRADRCEVADEGKARPQREADP